MRKNTELSLSKYLSELNWGLDAQILVNRINNNLQKDSVVIVTTSFGMTEDATKTTKRSPMGVNLLSKYYYDIIIMENALYDDLKTRVNKVPLYDFADLDNPVPKEGYIRIRKFEVGTNILKQGEYILKPITIEYEEVINYG
ncbi:hypothetical protein [Oceanotoga phage vB_OteS-UFV02]